MARILGVATAARAGPPAARGGRPTGPPSTTTASRSTSSTRPPPATGLTVRLPTDPDGKDVATGVTTYNFAVETHTVTFDGKTYRYFDRAKVTRK